jgi:hypothetical protein
MRKARKRPRKFRFSMTLLLIILNIAFFILTFSLGFFKDTCDKTICNNLALTPSYMLHGEKLWTIFTTMFVHGSAFHLIVNMMSLFFLGSFLENLIGKRRFIIVYLISGIIASLFFAGFAALSGETLPAVGASGAIFGLGGVLAVLTPKVPVYILFIPIAVPLWIGMGLMLAVLWIVSAAFGAPVGNTAHLGGFIAGLAYGFYLRFRYRRKIKMLDHYFRFRS